MSTDFSGRSALRVTTAGSRHFIEVPRGDSQSLLYYLRNHRIRSSFPQPSAGGVDNIELHRDVNLPVVQALLDGWA